MASIEPIKVLIAEDENSFRMVLQRVLLPQEAYTFQACASGDEVLELLREKQYDVIILDYDMPGKSGLNILQWMLEQKLDTPVIMLTGAGSENIAVEAMKLGAYDYIRKERFEKERLPQIINGAHERYLFRKEKELRERQTADQSHMAETFKLLSGSVRSVESLMDTSLSATHSELDQREKELLTGLSEEHRESVSRTFSRIRQHYATISFCTKALADLSNHILGRLRAGTDLEKDVELKQLLERIESYSRHER